MSIDAVTGLVTWTAPVVGTYTIAVGALDAGGLGVAQEFTLTARVNGLPVIQSPPSLSVTPGQAYRYDVIARDPEGGRLTYTLDATSIGKGMSLEYLGRLTWTPNSATTPSPSPLPMLQVPRSRNSSPYRLPPTPPTPSST
jgi:hypothetical protein